MVLTEEEELMIEEARTQIQSANLQNQQLNNVNQSNASFMEDKDRGMAEEQLNLSDELERIEHLLRGHIIKKDKQGVEYWDEPEDESMKILNEYGVRLLMKTISFYLSKRKLLSNYTIEEVNLKMLDFTEELNDLVFMKYRELGMDDSEKRKCYPMMIREIQDSVHDVYLRALGGKERDSIRKHWNLNEQVGTPVMTNQRGGGRQSIFQRNPLR